MTVYLLGIVWILIWIFRDSAVTLENKSTDLNVLRHRQHDVSEAGIWKWYHCTGGDKLLGLGISSRLSFRGILTSSSVSRTPLFSSRSPETGLLYYLFVINTYNSDQSCYFLPLLFCCTWLIGAPLKFIFYFQLPNGTLFGNRVVADAVNSVEVIL